MNARDSAISKGAALRVSELVLGILGGVALVLGGVVLFAGDEQYIGLGGEASWRVGDVGLAWAIGLLVVGAVAVLLDVALFRRDRRRDGGAVGAASGREDLIVHAAMFVLVNGFVWIQDIAMGGGVNYAWWLTVPWGIGLAVHAGVVLRGGAQQGRT